jgi:CheY-specific phosphatase CheX
MRLEASVINSRISSVLREAGYAMFGLFIEEAVDCSSQLFIEPLTSSISLKGPWTLTFSIRAETQVARLIVREVLDTATPTNEECQDFIGELANVLAGNFKARLPESTDGFFSLTPPYHGDPSVSTKAGWILSTRIPFSCSQGIIEVIAHVH